MQTYSFWNASHSHWFHKNSSAVSSPELFLLSLSFPLYFFPDIFCHRGWFCINTLRFSFTGLPGCAYAPRDHHRGLNSLPVSIDRKRWNGMLCLSAFWAAQRETIIISSALLLLPARSTADVPLYDWSGDRHTEEQTHAGRQVERQRTAGQCMYSVWQICRQTDRQRQINRRGAHSRHADRRVDSQPGSQTSTDRDINRDADRHIRSETGGQTDRQTCRHTDTLQTDGQSYSDV